MPSNNPEYQKQYIKEHYLKNKDYYKDKARQRNKKMITYLRNFTNRYKVLCGCIDCGYKANPLALQFDHVIGVKFKEVSRMVSEVYSLKSIKEEIRKCQVRCANCHMIKTHS